ncbi:MAG: ATP-binding protein [Deltaproteobacteria bacterium]|nr:ATP-binding protein [Deltaproteobacteria bacterium]
MIERFYWEKALISLSEHWRLTCMLGARQVGKSTFLRPQGAFYSFDDEKLRTLVKKDPLHWLQEQLQASKRIILDEATRLPSLFEAMKIIVDQNPNDKGRIWFASSSNYQLIKKIEESLAGRVFIYAASPLLVSEVVNNETPTFLEWLHEKKIKSFYRDEHHLIEKVLEKSLFPEPFLSQDRFFSKQWLEQYITTYLLRDLVENFPKVDFSKWQEFIKIFLSYPASTLSMNRLGQSIGVHHATIKEYIKISQAALICFRLPIYSKSTLKRLVKSEKYVMIDSALCKAYHAHISSGVLFENFIISQIIYLLNATLASSNFFHWRTEDGAEVDLVLEGDFGVIPIEIKQGTKISKNMFSGLNSFLDAHPRVKRALLFYEGSKTERYEKIHVLPVATLFL